MASYPEHRIRSRSRLSLSFEQLTDPGDPRLAACHREVMRDTLDAHDAALVAEHGFDEEIGRAHV